MTSKDVISFMDPTLPLYRQLSSQLFLLALSFFLLLFVGFLLFFQHEQNLAAIKYQQLPAIEKYNQRQLYLIQHDGLINEILVVGDADQIGGYYQRLNTSLKNISALSDSYRQLLAQMTQRLQMQAENISRLTQSSRRNIQLKDNAIIQLALVVDSLSGLMARQTSRQKDLSRQITQDNLTNRSMAIRAKALSTIVDSLTINRALHQSLIETLAMYKQLDLQYELVKFDDIQQKTQAEINGWLANVNDDSFNNINENGLFEQTTVLNALLFNEQNAFAKWRGQLRRFYDFRAELVKQKTELLPLLTQKLIVQAPKPSVVEKKLRRGLAKLNISFLPKHYIWSIVATCVVFAIIFVSLLVSVRRKIKYFGKQSTVVVTELVNTGAVLSVIPGREISEIINAVKQLSRPEYSEADYAQLQQRYQTQTAAMSRYSGHVFWQLPELSKKNHTAYALLGVEEKSQHWRRCFSRVDVSAILSSARQAKKQNSVEKISLLNQHGKAILLTIEYLNGKWFGSLCNVEDYRVLKDKNIFLTQQLQQQEQASKLAIIADCDGAINLINNAMIHRQKLSLAQGDEHLAYQQLQQLALRNEQQKTRAQLRRDDFVLTLATVNIANEIQTALINVSLNQVHKNNRIHLNLGSNLAPMITLENTLFQAMISTICQEILQDQTGVELDVDMQVIDVNSAQQIVRVSFQVNTPSHFERLSQVINALVIDDESSIGLDHAPRHYLRDLQLVFNVSNKEHQQLEFAGKFSFEMPLAIAEDLNKPIKNKPAKLKNCTLLVMASNKASQQRICHQLKGSKVVVETMLDLSLFKQQLSISNLTQQRLDAIILSPDVYSSDFDIINQQLMSLPVKLQPKILVIQPIFGSNLQRAGLYSVSDLPWLTGELAANVEQLLSQPNTSNLWVEPEIFSSFLFLPTQVEVLLAVTTVTKHKNLLRILQWFGLQVTVVSHQECLERLWQTGRYLVVITEFLPFKAKIEASEFSTRGVFSLPCSGNNQPNLFSKLSLEKSWHSGHLVPVLDIKQLTQQLSPWLKLDVNISDSYGRLAVEPKQRKKNVQTIVSRPPTVEKAEVTLKQGLNTADIELSLGFSLNPQQENNAQDEAFELTAYAHNQGSTELAAFMLDEYLADISAEILVLSDALKQHNYPTALKCLSLLINLAKVIAAGPLLAQCVALNDFLSQLIADKSAKEAISSMQKEQLQQQLIQLKLCVVKLTEFAEAI